MTSLGGSIATDGADSASVSRVTSARAWPGERIDLRRRHAPRAAAPVSRTRHLGDELSGAVMVGKHQPVRRNERRGTARNPQRPQPGLLEPLGVGFQAVRLRQVLDRRSLERPHLALVEAARPHRVEVDPVYERLPFGRGAGPLRGRLRRRLGGDGLRGRRGRRHRCGGTAAGAEEKDAAQDRQPARALIQGSRRLHRAPRSALVAGSGPAPLRDRLHASSRHEVKRKGSSPLGKGPRAATGCTRTSVSSCDASWKPRQEARARQA